MFFKILRLFYVIFPQPRIPRCWGGAISAKTNDQKNGFYKASLCEFLLLHKPASQFLKILQFWWLIMILFFITLITMNFSLAIRFFKSFGLPFFLLTCRSSLIYSKYEPFIGYISCKTSFPFMMGPRVKSHQLFLLLRWKEPN